MRKETIERFKRAHGAGSSGASSWTKTETGVRHYRLHDDVQGRKMKETRAANVGTVRDSGKPSDDIHVRAYRSADWFTTAGVLRKRRLIERKGLPSFNKWRFITLTLSRDAFSGDPLAGYLAGKAKLRKFMFAARKAGLWSETARWCWKLEFQKDGWAHWHLLVERKTKFSQDDFRQIDALWGLGITDTQMVRRDDFLYQFKYAFKPVLSEDAEGHSFAVPAWFADFSATKTVKVKPERESDDFSPYEAEKPVTFSRARFWQTSSNFYTGKKREVSKSEKDQETWSVPSTVRDVVERKACMVQVVSRGRNGRYRASGVITLSCIAGQFWDRVCYWAFRGGAVGLGVNSYVIPAQVIERNTQNTWTLKTLRKKNRLTFRAAARLQAKQVSLARC